MKEKLSKYDDAKLIDIVKNYKQYGYTPELRKLALEILESRGIDQEVLKLQGNYINDHFETSENYFKSSDSYSKIAFGCYIAILIVNIFINILPLFNILSFILIVGFIVSIIKTFIAQEKFYKTIQKKRGAFDILIYLLIGFPFYFLFYFYNRNQMKIEMNKIR